MVELLTQVTMKEHYRTDKGILVSETGKKSDAIWLPLSQLDVEEKPNDVVILTMPEWLAIKSGLV